MDTHYEPLLLAYYSWQYLLGEKTFVQADMKHGTRLDLASAVDAFRPVDHRYLYVYVDEG